MSDQSSNLRVEMKVGFKTKQHGRKVLSTKKPSEARQRPRQVVSREARLLALAHRWQRLISEGQIESQAEIAETMGITPARVSQILAMRWMSPAEQLRLLPPSNRR